MVPKSASKSSMSDAITHRILTLRGKPVLIDSDLASLYGTSTKVLNQAVRRNIGRFPGDFMFQLTLGEKQEVVTKCDHLSALKYSPHCPCAFTEHGALMVAAVLNTHRAVEVSVWVIRAFVRLREQAVQFQTWINELKALQHQVRDHDAAIRTLLAALEQLLAAAPRKSRPIGFIPRAIDGDE